MAGVLRHSDVIMPKRSSWTARATAALVCAIALLAAGCASSEPTSTDAIASESGSGGGDHIPATAYLSVTEYYPIKGSPTPEQGSLTYAVTDQRTIARFAALVESLPRSSSQMITPCPLSARLAYVLNFQQDAKDATPVAQVSTECFGVMVTVHEHREPILGNEAGFLRGVTTLLSTLTPEAGQSGAAASPSVSTLP